MTPSLDFLNKNMYRKFPFRMECDLMLDNGATLPQSIITSMQVTVPYGKHKIFAYKISYSANHVSLVISDYATNQHLGVFTAKLTKDFQVVKLTPFLPTTAGSLTIGRREDLQETAGTYLFCDHNMVPSKDAAIIEDSLIFCFTPPAVKSIQHEKKVATGFCTTLSTLPLLQSYPNIDETLLTISNVNSILPQGQIKGSYDNCPTPIIKKLNTVSPDENGNIDIYTINPLDISITAGVIDFTSIVELVDVCPEKNKISPPVNNTDNYFTNILTAISPEWKTWPRFNP